jgi:hypothetical protein
VFHLPLLPSKQNVVQQISLEHVDRPNKREWPQNSAWKPGLSRWAVDAAAVGLLIQRRSQLEALLRRDTATDA